MCKTRLINLQSTYLFIWALRVYASKKKKMKQNGYVWENTELPSGL